MLALGCDHGGFALKEEIKKHLSQQNIPFEDFGTFSQDSVDYPIIAQKTCAAVVDGRCEKAILCCGTGVGVSIAANKIDGIRAALCSDSYTARYSRLHNDANVICLGGRTIGSGLALELVDVFLSTPFEGGRHERRVAEIKNLEKRR